MYFQIYIFGDHIAESVYSQAMVAMSSHICLPSLQQVVELSPYLEEVYGELDPSSLRDMVDKVGIGPCYNQSTAILGLVLWEAVLSKAQTG